MNRILSAFSLCTLAAVSCSSRAAGQAATSPLSPLRFLVGDWVGAGSSDAGHITGRSSIKLDLGGQVLVRRDETGIPATKTRAASVMGVLMLIYSDQADGRLHATYTDSGGHVIQYTAARVVPGQSVEFDSEISSAAPTFRLTYTVSGPKSLKVKFEMAPPGSASVFHTIADGTDTRAGK